MTSAFATNASSSIWIYLPRFLRFSSLCAANAAAVATLYWNQALVQTIAVSFPGRAYLLSLTPMMTLAGYAAGVALIAFSPLTRMRSSIGYHTGFLVFSLVAAGCAPNSLVLAFTSFLVGCGAAVAQRLLALAARLGGPDGAGTAIGKALCAALVAVLCVRLVGGMVAHALGWRTVFFFAAACVAVTGLLSFLTRATYDPFLSNIDTAGAVRSLWWSSPLLRGAALQQAALFAAYNAAWMTVLLQVPAQERSMVVIGGCGAGLVAALTAGRAVDRLRRHDVARAGAVIVLTAAAFLLPLAYSATPGLSRGLLLLPGMALLDVGLQIALVANQVRVQALLPAARSRLAATLTVCGSLGGAAGAGADCWLWQSHGWHAASGLAAVASLVGLLVHYSGR